MFQSLIKPDTVPSIISGLINGIILIVIAMALSALIFTGSLSEYLSQGIGILLFGFLIYAIFSIFTASYPININTPQDIPVAIIALIATTVMATSGKDWSPESTFQFIFVTIALTSVVVGVFFFILGSLKLGKLVRFIPYPVVGGFLAGTGWLIIKFAFIMTADMELSLANASSLFSQSTLLQWCPGLIFGALMLIASRFISHYLLIPGIIALGISLFYAIMFFNGYSYMDLESSGLLLGPFPEGGLFQGSPIKYISDFKWHIFQGQLPALGTMMILNAISVLFNYSGLELIIKKDLDLDRELKVTGLGNILAGFCGAPPGHLALGGTSLAYSIGARSRLSTIVVAILCAGALFFGSKILSVFPRVILGGLLFNLGLSFVVDWLINTWNRVPKNDYIIIILIFLIIGTVGFLEGVLAGLMASVILFVISYSKVETIKHTLTGKTFHSNVERSERLKSIIEDSGDQILILPLQGYLFFGSANRLLEYIKAYLQSDDVGELKYLVFDFRQVTGVDSSTINSFNKLQILAALDDFKVLFCDLTSQISAQFEAEGLFDDSGNGSYLTFEDLDHGMEWCEEQIIADKIKDPDDRASEIKLFESQFSDLLPYFDSQTIEKNTKIIEQGADPKGLYFIKSGRVTVELDSKMDKRIRLKSMGTGTIVGEVSLYLKTQATASVITDEVCEIYFLSHENFEKLNRDASDRAAELHTYVIKLLSDRLAKSNATIHALMQ
ncbi:MAG TPA: SulP family inorganic anion transporter [Candidatus Marinimicrobia bacterium]|nr:SulP family inorganic anion transporter [Candidatus Neomarinimicrobiota bacterium]